MDYKIIDPLNYNNWDNIIKGFDEYSVFHTSAWIKILKETYNFGQNTFIFTENDEIIAIVPALEVKSFLTGTRGVALPFTDHCDFLIKSGINLINIIDEIIKFGKTRKWKYVEFRALDNEISECNSLVFFCHILDLARKSEKIYSGFRSNCKRNIKKAIRQNVVVEFANTVDALNAYYKLHSITRKRQGVPPQTFKFFENIFNEIIIKNNGNIILAKIDDVFVAGAIFLHIGEKVIYKFGASDYKYQNSRANNLLFWEAIKYYSKKGYKSLDFGRTNPEQEGLRQFKLGWGVVEKKISYYKYDINSEQLILNSSKNARIPKKIFQLLPISILKFIGSISYRHMG